MIPKNTPRCQMNPMNRGLNRRVHVQGTESVSEFRYMNPMNRIKGKRVLGVLEGRRLTTGDGSTNTLGHYNGVLRFIRFMDATLSSVISGLPMNPSERPTVHASPDVSRGGDVPTSGSLWGLWNAGIAEPRCFALKAKIEIENPFCRRGGFPTTNPKEPTWKI